MTALATWDAWSWTEKMEFTVGVLSSCLLLARLMVYAQERRRRTNSSRRHRRP